MGGGGGGDSRFVTSKEAGIKFLSCTCVTEFHDFDFAFLISKKQLL